MILPCALCSVPCIVVVVLVHTAGSCDRSSCTSISTTVIMYSSVSWFVGRVGWSDTCVYQRSGVVTVTPKQY